MDLSVTNYDYKPWNEIFTDYVVNLKDLDIDESWSDLVKSEMEKKYFAKLEKYLSHALKSTDGKVNIYPYPNLVFNAFNTTEFNSVKVVILGQDPYHNNEVHDSKLIPQAMGLSFSVPTGITVPSSLKNIYQNLLDFKHIKSKTKPTHGNLSSWAKQGCLLLNTSLTVQHGYPNSHCKFWSPFTDTIIKHISDNLENVVFVLWGAPSLQKLDLIDQKSHSVIISSHPSGLSYSKPLRSYPAFKDFDHFGKINEYLKKYDKAEINWEL